MNNNRIYYSHEAEQQAKREILMLVMLVTGLSISVSSMIALLFAPRSGDETREQLSGQVSEVMHKARQAAENVGDQVRENAESVRDTVQEQVQSRVN